MKTNEFALNLIKRFETFVDHVYICPAGWKTVGYGHVVLKGEMFTTITETEASELLQKDVVTAERGVTRLIKVPLTENQFGALVSFTFNCGTGALQASTLRQRINRGEQDIEVADEFLKWVYGGGRKLKGLIKRRRAERLLFLT